MILPDTALIDWASHGGLTPFDAGCVNPASIDLRLGEEYIELVTGKRLYGDIVLRPGTAILATTVEFVRMPAWAAGVLYLKSSLARMGLDHALAGWIDPGFCGELTMELHAHREIVLTAGQRIVQLVLMQMTNEPEAVYNGRYQGQMGPTCAR